jgi:hypothetical protein
MKDKINELEINSLNKISETYTEAEMNWRRVTNLDQSVTNLIKSACMGTRGSFPGGGVAGA